MEIDLQDLRVTDAAVAKEQLEFGDAYLEPLRTYRSYDANANRLKARNSDSGIVEMTDAQIQLLNRGESLTSGGTSPPGSAPPISPTQSRFPASLPPPAPSSSQQPAMRYVGSNGYLSHAHMGQGPPYPRSMSLSENPYIPTDKGVASRQAAMQHANLESRSSNNATIRNSRNSDSVFARLPSDSSITAPSGVPPTVPALPHAIHHKQHLYEELPADRPSIAGAYYSEPREVGPRIQTTSTPQLNKTLSTATTTTSASNTVTGSQENLWHTTPRSDSTTYRRKASNPLYDPNTTEQSLKTSDKARNCCFYRCPCATLVISFIVAIVALVLCVYLFVVSSAGSKVYLGLNRSNSTELLEKLQRLELKYDELQKKLMDSLAEQQLLRQQVSKMSTTVNARVMEDLQTSLRAYNNSIESIQGRLSLLSDRGPVEANYNQIEGLKKQIASMHVSSQGQNTTLVDYRSQILDLSSKFNELDRQILSAASTAVQLEQTQKKFDTQLSAVNSSLTQQIATVSKLPGPVGPQGPSGAGDLTSCKMITKEDPMPLTTANKDITNRTPWYPSNTDDEFIQHWVIMGIECTTEAGKYAHMEYRLDKSVLREGLPQYRCSCRDQWSGTQIRYCKFYAWVCLKLPKRTL